MGKSGSVRRANERARCAVRSQQVVKLKCQGYSFRQIGRMLGVNDRTVRRDFDSALAVIRDETPGLLSQLRALEMERLDVATRAIADRVMNAQQVRDDDAIKLWIKITEVRAKLLGLNRPEGATIVGRVRVSEPPAEPTRYIDPEVFKAASLANLERLGLIEIKVQPRQIIAGAMGYH